VRRRSLGRPVPQEGRPEGSVGSPVLLPEPRRERASLRPVLARRRWRPRRRRRQPRRHELGGRHRVIIPRHRAAAFTLIEMVMVLLIIGLGSALVVPLVEGGFEAREVRRAARQIAGTMHFCRGEAVALGEPQELIIDPTQNSIHTTARKRWAVLTDRAVIDD